MLRLELFLRSCGDYGQTLDGAFKALHDTGQLMVMYEMMARRIIAAAGI
jgi:hypothetical protein